MKQNNKTFNNALHKFVGVLDKYVKIRHKLSNLMGNLFLPVICTSCLLKGISGMQFLMQI